MPTGNFAMHLAAHRDLPKVIAQLASKGMDANILNHRKETPLEVAAQNGAMAASLALLRCRATATPSAIEAARKRHGAQDLVRLLETAARKP